MRQGSQSVPSKISPTIFSSLQPRHGTIVPGDGSGSAKTTGSGLVKVLLNIIVNDPPGDISKLSVLLPSYPFEHGQVSFQNSQMDRC
jgi:hypothetical protein